MYVVHFRSTMTFPRWPAPFHLTLRFLCYASYTRFTRLVNVCVRGRMLCGAAHYYEASR